MKSILRKKVEVECIRPLDKNQPFVYPYNFDLFTPCLQTATQKSNELK